MSRTTITLTNETEKLIRRAMSERGTSFKDTVNEAIVRGLTGEGQAKRYVLPTFSMGVPRVDLDKATQLAAELENDDILRKMALGK